MKKRIILYFALIGLLAAMILNAFRVSCPSMGLTQKAVCGNGAIKGDYGFLDYAQETEFVIPGLTENLIPQGIAVWKEKNRILISGYFKPTEEHTSAILMLRSTDGKFLGAYSLEGKNGRAYSGHFGGIAVTETDLYVANDHKLLRVPLQEFGYLRNGGELHVAQEIPVHVEASACCYADGVLWVCEYYQKEQYPLRGEHEMVNRDGDVYRAWMVGYGFRDGSALVPEVIFSVPDTVQGITVLEDGRIMLSRSFGRKSPSVITVCNDPRRDTAHKLVDLDGITVPLYFLDGKNGMEEYSAPPMAEGCCATGAGAYLIFESAASYYRILEPGNRSLDPTDRVWKFVPPK